MEKSVCNINPAVVNIPQKAARNYGVDLLRIVSMLMVVILHILGHGGILKGVEPLSKGYAVGWFLELASYCAVNCYALISGYVGSGSRFKYSGIVGLWLQTAFYSVSIAAVAAYFLPNIGKKEVISALFPVSNNVYWYFTAYFCMYFFTPLLNKIIEGLSEKQLKAIAVTFFLVLSVLPTINGKDIFRLSNGYSAIWLAVLYILGGTVKKCNLFAKVKSGWFILAYLGFTLISFGERAGIEFYNQTATEKLTPVLTSYTSPTVLLAAMALIIGFSRMNIGKISSAFIKYLAPVSFGVYLIHENPYTRINIIKKIFPSFIEFNAVTLFFAVLGSAVAIYLICGIIEFLREQLFKLLRVKKTLAKIEGKVFGDLWAPTVNKG